MFNVRTTTAVVAMSAVIALAPAAFAATPGNFWRMDLMAGVVQDANGSQPITFVGAGILSANGLVGGAVEFRRAPSFGTIKNSKGDNPGTQDFAMGIVFTTQPIPQTNYSGNLMQKGLFADSGQVKLQLAAASKGTVNCRVKGRFGAKIITSTVNVDNGAWHTAVCWRAGNVVGLTVDGFVKSLNWNPGSISNSRPILLGNKGIDADASDQHFGRTDFASWVIDSNARLIVERQVVESG